MPAAMLAWAASKLACSSGVASSGVHCTLMRLPAPSALKRVVESVCSGQLALSGRRVRPRPASENWLTSTRLCMGTMTRKVHSPHRVWPSGMRMP
jgi:hypothetical protein